MESFDGKVLKFKQKTKLLQNCFKIILLVCNRQKKGFC